MSFKLLLESQMHAARDAGYQVHGVSAEGPYFPELRRAGFRMHGVPILRSISPWQDLITPWRLYRYFRRERIDIVHTHTPKPGLLGQLAARLARVPVIVNTIHGFYFHEHMRPITRRFYVAMEWIAARCSTAILSQNPEDIQTAVELGICARDKITLLGNGIDLARFDPDRFDVTFIRPRRVAYGLPQDAIVVGIVGRLVREKGYRELFAAMRLPIVATNIRGCRQVVTDGANGLLVPLRDPAALEQALRRLIDDEPLRKRMGQAGYERTRKEFDERRVCQIMLRTYAEQLDKRRRASRGY